MTITLVKMHKTRSPVVCFLILGWRTSKCEYSPEKGNGVGDDLHSYAFDGARLKVWNGPGCRMANNDYGEMWAANDIVSCLLSWDGDIEFWLNGVSLGVAFENINTELDYYPAVSLAMDQHCSFNFGGDQPFRYSCISHRIFEQS